MRLAVAVDGLADRVPATTEVHSPADYIFRTAINIAKNRKKAQTYRVSATEIDALIADAVAATGATSIKDMGKVMGIIKGKAAGRADMAAVGAKIKARLGG